MTVELVTQREYARRRGVSQPAIAKAIKAGRIKTTDGKIDPAQADIEWSKRTQKQAPRGDNLDVGGAPPGRNGGNRRADAGDTGSSRGHHGVASGDNYAQARAEHEAYKALLAKLEYETQSGKLIPVDEVRVILFNVVRMSRHALEGMPAQLAAILAAESNEFEVHRILDEAVRRNLNDLATAAASAIANAP